MTEYSLGEHIHAGIDALTSAFYLLVEELTQQGAVDPQSLADRIHSLRVMPGKAIQSPIELHRLNLQTLADEIERRPYGPDSPGQKPFRLVQDTDD